VKIEPRLNQTLNQDSTGTLERLGRTILDGLPSHPTPASRSPDISRRIESGSANVRPRQDRRRSPDDPGRDRESELPRIADVAEAVENA
jgi:hypothetical protein